MRSGPRLKERRTNPRIHLGVPVRVHYAGEVRTLTLELANVSADGCYFRTSERRPRVGQWIAFGFVEENRSVCTACGRAVRTDAQGFAVRFERTNESFRNFLDEISSSYGCAA
jgi:hypothetical protein